MRIYNPGRYEYLLPDRKHRLLACALCRQIEPLVGQPELLRVLEASEAFADGLVTDIELGNARHLALQLTHKAAEVQAQEKFASAVARAATLVLPSSLNWFKTVDPLTVSRISGFLSSGLELLATNGVVVHRMPEYVALFDEVEPRRVTCSPVWRTDTALALARQMYAAREFDAMPILADALQDAGCENADMLDHCRGPGPHVRGCWVVDMVLGKE